MSTPTITESIRFESERAEAAATAHLQEGERIIRRLLHRHEWGKDIVVQHGAGTRKMRVCGFYVRKGGIMLIARRLNEQGEMQGRGIGIPARGAGRSWWVTIEERALQEKRRAR